MKRLLLVLATAIASVALFGLTTTTAQARSLEILSVDVTARVNPDGSMNVVERLAFDFEGDFNGGTRDIPQDPFGRYRLTDFEVSEDGDQRDLAPGFDDPNSGEVRWFGSASHDQVTGEHTYDLSYTVENAIEVFPDVGVLNWQFIGFGFPELDRVAVDVTMPGDGTGLRAFAHGDLRGVVEPVGNTVLLRVFDNPPGSPVEARIVVPAAAFTVTPSGAPALDQILAQEGAFADAANQARADAGRAYAAEVDDGLEPGCTEENSDLLERRCEQLQGLLDVADDQSPGEPLTLEDADTYFSILQVRDEIRDEVDRIVAEREKGIGQVAAPVVAVVGAGAWFLVWRKWGKDPEHPEDIGEYFREVPEESPAVVAAIDDWGVVDAKAFACTIIDLAQRGWLTITPEGKEHRFTRSQQTEDELPLKGYESKALWKLFEGGRPTVTQDELVDEAKANRTSSASWMATFKAEVKADYEAQQYQEKHGCLPWLLHVLIVLTVGAAAALAFAVHAWVGLAVAGATALVLFVLGILLRARTEKGARKHAEVKGLKNFLRDFSLVDDVPVGHLALYERYLVYAVALGVADRLIAGMRVRFPELSDPNAGFATWYVVGAYGHGGGGGFDKLASLGTVGSFANDFSSATASAFSPPSSSSGTGGGGFSGGFSGGGGGGGAGGW